MSNIFRALEQAQRERIDSSSRSGDSTAGNSQARPRDKGNTEIIELCRAVEAQLPGQKMVQFISAYPGEGVSFVVSHFARVSAESLDKKVLIITAVSDAKHAAVDFPLTPDKSGCYQQPTQGGGQPEERLVHPPVLVTVNSCLSAFKAGEGELCEFARCFDLVLLDTPSLSVEPFGVELVKFADGVVLVLEAERTKVFAAENLKDQVLQNGGKLLGVVLNKRCYHVPFPLYRWLH